MNSTDDHEDGGNVAETDEEAQQRTWLEGIENGTITEPPEAPLTRYLQPDIYA